MEWVLDIFADNNAVPPILVHLIETTLDMQVGNPAGYATTPEDLVARLENCSDVETLRVVDFLLGGDMLVDDKKRGRLDRILKASRSAWTIGQGLGRTGLIERVPSRVQEAAESISARTGAAGNLLREAWDRIHMIDPSPSEAAGEPCGQ